MISSLEDLSRPDSVLVLGAGASADYGFPIWAELSDQIAEIFRNPDRFGTWNQGLDLDDRDLVYFAERIESVLSGQFGVASDQPRIIAWAYEMSAWFAESLGDDDLVIKATSAGQAAAPASDVAAQLAGKEAEVLARRGDRKGAKELLDRAIQWIEDLPYPDNPGNHFTVDPYKFGEVAMRVSRLLGDHDAADLYAKQIIRKGMRPDGTHVMPMRVVDAKSSMAATALERCAEPCRAWPTRCRTLKSTADRPVDSRTLPIRTVEHVANAVAMEGRPAPKASDTRRRAR